MLAGKQKFFIVILKLSCFFFSQNLSAQFAPGPQEINTTAVFKDDTSKVSFWANEIILNRSWQDISDTTLGKTTVGVPSDALGKANGKIVSLGDAGSAVLKFPFPIYNVTGFDFAVFENGFTQDGDPDNFYFMELALIEVSQNGIDFFPFLSTSNIDTVNQVGSFETTNCSEVNNLAGKYPLNYGTPFDIDELGLDSIVSIKIIDAVGSMNSLYSSFDALGTKINDPFPTPYPSSGFDLNAIAALNQPNKIIDTTLSVNNLIDLKVSIYPNPISQNSILNIITENGILKHLSVKDINGREIIDLKFKSTYQLKTNNLEKGIYFMSIYDQVSFFSHRFIVK